MTATYGAGILSAVVLASALRAKLDKETGWHKSISNVPIASPTGISHDLSFDFEDPDTDVGYLNRNEITTLIQHNGFRFWGNRTPSSQRDYVFEVAVRTQQTLKDSINNACFEYADQPLTPYLAKDIIDTINAYLRSLSSGKDRRLMGGMVWFDSEQNPPENLTNGILWIDYDFGIVPPLENLGLNNRITGRYMVDFAKLINGTGDE